jgi:hypothetical protein
MAAIIQRTFPDGTNKGIALGYVSGSNDASMTRTLTVGSNWSVIRMGILCGIKAGNSQPYQRNYGLALGFCNGTTGSATDVATANNARSWVGAFFGAYIQLTGFTSTYWFWHNTDTSGSGFGIDTIYVGGQTAGSFDAGSSINLTTNTGNFWFANNAATPNRKIPLILELSASSTTNVVVKCFGVTGSRCNQDYTADQLITALTAATVTGITSSYGTASFSQKWINNITHNTAAAPFLDTAFIDWSGGSAFEIYDWYIYKVR